MQPTIQYIKKELQGIYPLHEIEAFTRLMFENVCGMSYTDLILNKNKTIESDNFGKIKEIVSRLKAYEPIQYILGETDFCGLTIQVNPSVLIPRPETEELVALIVSENYYDSPYILDIGTGSGCISLALKTKIPDARLDSIDISEAAIETAKVNGKLCQQKVNFFRFNIYKWEELIWPKYDIIVSNPPYVRNSEKIQMQKNVLHYEPENALFVSDEDPLIYYRTIAQFAKKNIKKSGRLYFELNENLAFELKKMLNNMHFTSIKIFKDINKKNRMLRCMLN